MKIERVVIDTNVHVSAALIAESAPTRARDHALHHARLIGTADTIDELVTRLRSAKFDRYSSRAVREILIQRLAPVVELVVVTQQVRACRDPRDDKFLEAAVNGSASVIISGDKDLLALHPFQGILILSPSDYLERFSSEGE